MSDTPNADHPVCKAMNCDLYKIETPNYCKYCIEWAIYYNEVFDWDDENY